MHLSKVAIIYLLAVITLNSCSTFNNDGRISEGVIEFDVTYPKTDPESILAELLPNKMTMSFKDNLIMTDLSAGFGMFRMNVISYGNDKELAQMVKLINDRFVVKYDEQATLRSISSEPEVSIELSKNTKEIAGFVCKEAIVTVKKDEPETYNIYYTDEIHIEQPNWFTQLTKIDGVMLEYQVERYGLCSKFSASKITPQEVNESIFEVPEEYIEIQEDEMNKKMEEIFNSLSE